MSILVYHSINSCQEIKNRGAFAPRLPNKRSLKLTQLDFLSKNFPKKFRQTFTNRLQNLALDVIENIYHANDVLLTSKNLENYKKRLDYQQTANSKLKLLEYFALLAYENDCLLFRHYEQIAKQGAKCKILLANWIASDAKRI